MGMMLRHLGYSGQPQKLLPLVSPRLLVLSTMVVPHFGQTGAGPVWAATLSCGSLPSIKAVLDPAQNDYFYFVADVTTGKVYFAKTLAEQNANVQKYVNDKISS